MDMAGGDIGASGQLLLELVHDVGRINGFGDVYRRECTDFSRRIGVLSQLFEDIRDFKGDNNAHRFTSTSSPCSSCLQDLLGVLRAAKRLLLVARNYDSKTSPDLARKKVTFQFQCITWKLERALGNIPYDQFNISEEAQEQVELVRSQLRRVAKKNGSLNSKIVSRTLSESLDKTNMPDLANRVIGSLYVENLGNVDHESQAVMDIAPKVTDKMGHNMEQMIHELERPHSLSASSEAYILNKADLNNKDDMAGKSSEESKKHDSVVIPDDFLCPISLELMRDPVIVTTGQTYERSYIQRWINCGNRTCPKTQQKLQNLTLTPNYVLRSLITHWCVKNNVELPMGLVNSRIRKNDGPFQDVSGDIEAINALVHKLSSQSMEDQRSAAAAIRSLSKTSTDNRILIAEAGAIPILVKLLTTDDVRTQENVVTCILNLSIYVNNKPLIMLAGAVPSIIQILRMGSKEAKENAAATLFSLSLVNENKIIIGESGGIAALIGLLQNGSSRGKKDAATALFYLCLYQGNKGRAVRSGILLPLKQMLIESSSCMVGEALSILSVLVSHQDCKVAIAKATIIPALIDLLRTGLSRNKENAAAILHSLCKKNAENLECIARLGAFIPLGNLANSGTDRAKRKASSLLEHLQKSQML
ncbi:U-box domain-containing protein 11-like [Telopea speciosissima]|uniref:U-box domain-containing protein 11-like n=1 Tax=Telopea speciosissima TaxID=54955 RepID=UPI001CC8297A|nr:U-box domain-containing protein 11-like [Telopea speciosissima]